MKKLKFPFRFDNITSSFAVKKEKNMPPKDDIIGAKTEVSTTELATVLGITGRRIRQMVEDGQMQKIEQGRFLLADSVQRYIRFLSSDEMDEEDTKIEKTKRIAETHLKAFKARIAKMEADELADQMFRAEDVKAMTEDLVFTIRSALNSLPGRLAVDVSAAKTAAEASEIIRKEVDKVMREIAAYRYDPKCSMVCGTKISKQAEDSFI